MAETRWAWRNPSTQALVNGEGRILGEVTHMLSGGYAAHHGLYLLGSYIDEESAKAAIEKAVVGRTLSVRGATSEEQR